jgi:hypothetical protein
MLQLNLNGPAQYMPASYPMTVSRGGAARPPTSTMPPNATTGGGLTVGGGCGYGYVSNNGVCMSQGCIDGRSQCVVMDGYGRTCSYDQLLAFQAKTGTPACGPAPALPAPPNAPSVPGINPPQPGIPVDVSPNPGTQIVATVPASQVYATRIPRWALVIGGLSVVAIIAALLVRR